MAICTVVGDVPFELAESFELLSFMVVLFPTEHKGLFLLTRQLPSYLVLRCLPNSLEL